MNDIATTNTTLDKLTANIKLELIKIEIRTEDTKRANNESSVKIGEWLTNAKTFLKHGEWQNWLNGNFNMTDRTARRYMKIAAYFGQNGHFPQIMSVFNPTSLIELTMLPVNKLQDFIDNQNANGVDFSKIKVKELRESIKKWNNPIQNSQTITIDVNATI